MKKIVFSGLTILLVTAFFHKNTLAQGKKGNRLIINAVNYGLDTMDATAAIRKTLEASKTMHASKLIIPKGIYHFYPLKAIEKYYSISNNDNGLKRIAFYLSGLKNFEIDAQGSTFIFHGKIVPFVIDSCSSVSLKNFTINWARPFHSEGEVVNVDLVNRTFDLHMTTMFPYEIQGNELIYKGEGWKQGLQENVFFDPLTKRIAYDDTKYVMDPWSSKLDYSYNAREITKGVVRILDTISKKLPKVGWIFITKGFKEPNREIPAIVGQNSFDLSFSNINIYHAGSMGFIIQKSGNIDLERIAVTPPPQSKRYLSLGSDATHFVNCKGYISIRNSLFENMHDDAVNIQGVYAICEDTVNRNTISIRFKHHQQFGFPFGSAGDDVRLVDPQTLLPYKNLKVQSFKKINEEYSQISFTQDISDIIKKGTAIENMSWHTDSVLIENCTIRNNRARSILVSTLGKVRIRRNFLSSEMAGIAIGGEADYWAESGAVNDVLIEDNLFKDCCTSELNQSIIQIAPSIRKLTDTVFYHRNINIINNHINTFDRKILYAKSTDGLNFSNNTIIQTNTYKPFYTGMPSIELVNCRGVVLKGNNFLKYPAAKIKVDLITTNGIKVLDNKGLTY